MSYTPKVGDTVRVQLWQPGNKPQREVPYGPPRIMRLMGIVEGYNGPGITRYWLVDPKRPKDESLMSWCESDWADLESAAEESGVLF